MTDVLTDTSSGTRRRRWQLFVIVAVVIALVACAGLDLWAEHRLNVVAARFAERFGSLSPGHLTTAPVPAVNNRAHLIRAASAMTVPMSPAATTALASVTRTPDLTPLPADLRAFVEANGPALGLLAGAGLHTESSWVIEHVDPSNVPSWMDIRPLSQAAFVAALLKIEAGEPDAAAAQVAAGLTMAASFRQEPNLIAQLIRIAIAIRQFDAIQRLITRAEPSKASLAEIARCMEEIRTPDPMRVGLLGEARMAHAMLTRLEGGRVDDGLPGRGPSVWTGPLVRLGRPFVRIAHGSLLQHLEQLADWQAGPGPRLPFEPTSRVPRVPLVGNLTDGLTAGLERAVTTGDDFTSILGATELAVALRRYRLDRNSYPDDLTMLVPAYLSAVPVNPFTGKPPVYARQGGGFTLTAPQSQIHATPAPPTPEWTVAR